MATKAKPRSAQRPAENALGVELVRVLKKTGSLHYNFDERASRYVKAMLDQIFGENNFENRNKRGMTSGN